MPLRFEPAGSVHNPTQGSFNCSRHTTVHSNSPFMAATQFSQRDQVDCQHLRSFFSGKGPPNNQKLMEIITSRSLEERKRIRQAYSARYDQDFLHQLSNTQRNNNFNRLAYLCMEESHERDAELMRDALFSVTVDHNALIEIAGTRSSSQLRLVKQAYRDRYRSNVEQDIAVKIYGSLKEVLVAMMSSYPGDGYGMQMSMAMCDAKTLYEAIESGKSIDKKTIISLITQRSTDQIRTILHAYKQLYGHELSKSLKREKCGEFGTTLRSLIRCVQHPEKHFAKQLRRTWSGGQWRSSCQAQELLVRTIATRSDVDVGAISAAFAAKSGLSLEAAIRREFTTGRISNSNGSNGLLADFLIALIKH